MQAPDGTAANRTSPHPWDSQLHQCPVRTVQPGGPPRGGGPCTALRGPHALTGRVSIRRSSVSCFSHRLQDILPVPERLRMVLQERRAQLRPAPAVSRLPLHRMHMGFTYTVGHCTQHKTATSLRCFYSHFRTGPGHLPWHRPSCSVPWPRLTCRHTARRTSC